MANLITSMLGWFGWGGALGNQPGAQIAVPGVALVEGTANIGADGAMQIGAVWACVDRRATCIASLPFMTYRQLDAGQKELARESRLWQLLHDTPNARMTPFDFWRVMMLNHDLRGNAYARIERDESSGEALSLWPMAADQVRPIVLDDGSMVYTYAIGGSVVALAEENVLHLRNLGNGTVGLDKLSFMRAATDEAAKAQQSASKMWGNSGKPTGVLMLDNVLKPEQRAALQARFAEMATGSTARLYILEAQMKYQQLSITPEQQQLLESRRYGVEEVCRWFDVPPVLVHHSNVTTWGSGIEQIVDGFYKFTVRPMLVSIEQAVRKRVMTPKQRATLSVEWNLDALLRGSAKDRFELYSKGVQNGIITRNEARQLENLSPSPDGNDLTAQSNLLPLGKLGQEPPKPAPPAEPMLQSEFARIERERLETKAQADGDRRHAELLGMIRALQKPQPIVVNNNMAEQPSHVFNIDAKNEPQPAPVINITNQVNPTPVDVSVTNEVNPTPVNVDAHFEAVVQAGEVTLNMPDRRSESTVERDQAKNIVKTVTIEKNL